MCDPVIAFGGQPLGKGMWMKFRHGEKVEESGIEIYAGGKDDPKPAVILTKDAIEELSAIAGFLFGELRSREKVMLSCVRGLERQVAELTSKLAMPAAFGEKA